VFIPQYNPSDDVEDRELLIIAGMLYSVSEKINPKNIWEEIGYWRACSRISVKLNNSEYQINFAKKKPKGFIITIAEETYKVEVTKSEQNIIGFTYNGKSYEFIISKNDDYKYFISNNGDVITFERNDILKESDKISSNITTDNNTVLKSTMPGKVIKILVAEGEKVNKDDELIIIESMKMENSYYAKENGIIEKINVRVNDNITADSELIIFGKNNEE
jgi:biotin carboxyl carrier protein